MTFFPDPILLPGESPSPSHVLKTVGSRKLIVWVIVCEFPKTISRFAGTLVPSGRRKSLSSAATGRAGVTARLRARSKRVVRGIFSSLLAFRNAKEFRVDADFRVDRLGRFDLGRASARRQRVEVLDHLGASVALSLGLELLPRWDGVTHKDRRRDRDDHVGRRAAGVITRDAAGHRVGCRVSLVVDGRVE